VRGSSMSCFSCFGPALEPQDGKKPVPADAAKDLRKDGSAPRGGGSGADLGIFCFGLSFSFRVPQLAAACFLLCSVLRLLATVCGPGFDG
jgi:hypothetical protein